jgi:hypothetical protein
VIEGALPLARRLERYRAAAAHAPRPLEPGPAPTESRGQLAERLAAAMAGDVVATAEGTIVRCEVPTRPIPLDRRRLATLPGQPPPDVPLVCLDTETTGLATAAGTVAWLIGLGWWEGETFHQAQLLLPDHSDERALLTALADLIAPNAWLVTYNGRGFDWPLLVARYRLARRAAPVHAGHLDLLPIVRRLFRHRMENARLRTAESALLGMHRIGDIEGWEIPSRYLRFLRGGSADDLVDVVRHNDQDVRSLARLLALLESNLGDPGRRAEAASGDLAGLARAFAREHRLGEALDCLDLAIDRSSDTPAARAPAAVKEASRPEDDPWWSPRRPADFGGRSHRRPTLGTAPQTAAFDAPWTTDRIAIDRAHLLRRLGRYGEAVAAWDAVSAGTSRSAIIATIELAKLHEHRLRDRGAALRAVLRGFSLIERRRRIGMPEPALEADLIRRHERLVRRRTLVRRRAIA